MEEIERSCWPVTFKALVVFGGVLAAGALLSERHDVTIADNGVETRVSAIEGETVTD